MIIDVKRVYTWFESRFRLSKSSQGWFTFDCPYCGGHRKMAVHMTYGLVKCWVCEARMRAMDFIADIEGLNGYQARQMIYSMKESDFVIEVDIGIRRRTGALGLPKGFRYLLDGDTVLGNRARNYLKSRKFDLNELDSMGIGYCDDATDEENENYFGYIILPFIRKGELVYYIGRDFINNFLRYKNPAKELTGVGKSDLVFNEDALMIEDTVYIVEGVFDALVLGRQGTATMGWSMSTYQKSAYLKGYSKRLIFVPDKEFYKQAVKTAMDFVDHKEVYVVCTDNILPDDDSKKDVNDLGRDLVLEELSKTERLTFADALSIIA